MAQSNPPLDSQYTKGRFANKVSIITGGSSGIGRATVKRFVNDGAAVAVFDINEPDGKKLQDELTASGYHVKFYKVDVADKEQCVQGVKKVAEDHEGKIHFLVNNAAISAPCKGLDSSKKDWDRLLGINLIGYSNMVQACYPFMTKGTLLHGHVLVVLCQLSVVEAHTPCVCSRPMFPFRDQGKRHMKSWARDGDGMLWLDFVLSFTGHLVHSWKGNDCYAG
ncbi:3-oxoacyl-[acyl-carrier-protein] reductase FabG-like [Oculina patagonica]